MTTDRSGISERPLVQKSSHSLYASRLEPVHQQDSGVNDHLRQLRGKRSRLKSPNRTTLSKLLADGDRRDRSAHLNIPHPNVTLRPRIGC